MKILKIDNLYTSLKDITQMVKDNFSTETEPAKMILFAKDKCILVYLPDIGDRKNGGREKSIKFAQAINLAYDADKYVIAHESHILGGTDRDEMEEWVGKLEEHPDVREALTIIACEKGKSLMSILEITKDRKLINESTYGGGEGEEIRGEFTMLAPHWYMPPLPEDLRELLKKALIDAYAKDEEGGEDAE